MRDYYHVLGVSPNARGEEIVRAHRQLARRYHPDIWGEDQSTPDCASTGSLASQSGGIVTGDVGASRSPAFADRRESVREWCADEVAIDFPAIDEVLDRMRAAFFGAHDGPPPLSVDVVVTPHEAFYGSVVPLDVPVRGVCAACGGRGETWPEPCGHCHGTGERVEAHRLRLILPAGTRPGTIIRVTVAPPSAPATPVDVHVVVA
jgi:molecular chaperone DnaJ